MLMVLYMAVAVCKRLIRAEHVTSPQLETIIYVDGSCETLKLSRLRYGKNVILINPRSMSACVASFVLYTIEMSACVPSFVLYTIEGGRPQRYRNRRTAQNGNPISLCGNTYLLA